MRFGPGSEGGLKIRLIVIESVKPRFRILSTSHIRIHVAFFRGLFGVGELRPDFEAGSVFGRPDTTLGLYEI